MSDLNGPAPAAPPPAPAFAAVQPAEAAQAYVAPAAEPPAVAPDAAFAAVEPAQPAPAREPMPEGLNLKQKIAWMKRHQQ